MTLHLPEFLLGALVVLVAPEVWKRWIWPRVSAKLSRRHKPIQFEHLQLVEVDLIQRWFDGVMGSTAAKCFSGENLADGIRAMATYVKDNWSRVELIVRDDRGGLHSIWIYPDMDGSDWCLKTVDGKLDLTPPYYSDLAHPDRVMAAS